MIARWNSVYQLTRGDVGSGARNGVRVQYGSSCECNNFVGGWVWRASESAFS